MKHFAFAFCLLVYIITPLSGQSVALFDDSRIAAIYLELPEDSLDFMIDELVNDHYFSARFIFDDGDIRDTVQNAGLRLRGNTSLYSQKKSFKVSFNEFEAGREYQDVRKLNLNGQHNDPTLVREKLFYDVWKKAGMPERRTAFVKLYINGEYRGLYTNVEEIDKQWLDRAYGNNDGNLFKCTYPATLAYLGGNAQSYKNIQNNPETRAYDLVTNELADDYSRLVELITTLNQPVTAAFPDQINQILNVDAVLKAFALDVATGNWDDYFYNKNNYYLYDNPESGRFEFVTYDTDNTFGVDWLGQDWAKRNCLDWYKHNDPRPLATKLLAVPAFKEKYVHYLDTIVNFITLPDSIFTHIDALHNLITSAAGTDTYRTLDYGYDLGDFHNGFTQTIDGHTPYGIKPFLGIRGDSVRSQIGGILSNAVEFEEAPFVFRVYPNPASEWLYVQVVPEFFSGPVYSTLIDATGRIIDRRKWETTPAPYAWPVKDLPVGPYLLQVRAGKREAHVVFLKEK